MTLSASASAIRFEHIEKSYEGRKVLHGVSLEVTAGHVFGLIGLNGVGKTTLIKILLQLTQADAGRAVIFGQDAGEVGAREQLLYLPERFQPSKYLTGQEYLELSLRYYREEFSWEEAKGTAEELDLDPTKLTKPIASYSKGMGQKIGLIAAFLAKRPLLILDEPMSGLDPLARIRLKEKLLAYKAAGNTVFFSSHILSDIDEICDRIGIIHHGKLLYEGTPVDFKRDHPAPSLEKSFLNAIAA